MVDLLDYFVKNGIYKLNNTDDEFIFLCTSSSQSIGKLVQYKLNGSLYEKTGVTYFLNSYHEGDVKSLFVCRENYDIIGMLGQNFVLSDNEQYILKG